MRTLKRIVLALAGLLSAAVLGAVFSLIAERYGGDVLISLNSLRITVSGIGAALSFLTFLLFAALWRRDCRKRKGSVNGSLLNAIGFGFLPAAAVWKAFEQGTFLSEGIPAPDPLPPVPFLTVRECVAVSGTESVLAVLCFFCIVLWLMIRRDDLTGNGELLLTVVCVWGMIRALTESLRVSPVLCAGSVNLTQVLFLAAAMIPSAIWIRRLGKAQKNTVFILVEGITVLCCGTIMVLITSGILSVGSDIGDLALIAGCSALGLLLILLTGKDSRT